MRTCTVCSRATHVAHSKCRAGCGGRGRCAHLAALDEENKDVVVVARLKECHASLHGMQAWMAAHEEEQVRKCDGIGD